MVVMNGFELTQLTVKGAATDPSPLSDKVDSESTSQISWAAPVDDDIDTIDGYDVYFGTIADPNITDNPMSFTADTFLPVSLNFGTTYFWRVDTHITWTNATSDIVTGFTWQFTTLPDDKTPVVDGDNVLTSMEFLPASLSATVDDWGEGDVVGIAWDYISADVPATAMQMITRTGETEMENLAEITDDPNLLMDWIGIDTRTNDVANNVFGNPFSLTLKGLPAGEYTWKSYHHDPENLAGIFDVKVIDDNGAAVTTGIQATSANTIPVSFFETTITANGTDDVIVIFTLQIPVEKYTLNEFFVMNGFELFDGSNSLNVDFDQIIIEEEIEVVHTMPGFERYAANHEVAEDFVEQSYDAFGTSVSVLPAWGGLPVITDDVNDPTVAAQAATLTSDWPGIFTVRASATDNAGQIGSVDLLVRVAADACQGAQWDTANWPGFNAFDFNSDCLVNVNDFASFASQWLDDKNLPGQK